jgi:hypothetical protein
MPGDLDSLPAEIFAEQTCGDVLHGAHARSCGEKESPVDVEEQERLHEARIDEGNRGIKTG